MKSFPLILSILLFSATGCICLGQNTDSSGGKMQGLGKYWFVLYTKGPNFQDSVTRRKIFQQHLDYIIGLRKSGKIITGGAFEDRSSLAGFEIYNCTTSEEAGRLTDGDPMVKSKVFSYEIHPWMTLKGTVSFD
jgi:uncharacterized protein YciI